MNKMIRFQSSFLAFCLLSLCCECTLASATTNESLLCASPTDGEHRAGCHDERNPIETTSLDHLEDNDSEEHEEDEEEEEEDDDEEDEEDDDEEDDDFDYEEEQDFKYDEHLRPGEMSALQWKSDSKVAHPFMLEVALPTGLQKTMYEYAERHGFTDLFETLTVGNEPIETSSERRVTTTNSNQNNEEKSFDWLLQRPAQKYFSNMHWIGPQNEETHFDILQMLGDGGFDSVLQGLADKFELDSLTVVQVTYMGVSFCDGHFFHWDFPDTGGKAFNIIVPVQAGDDTPPELQVQDEQDEERTGGYLYKAGRAIVLGDNGMHATGKVHYEDSYRVGATIYVADIHQSNVKEVIRGFTQAYPPRENEQWALDHAGMHYDRRDPTRKLPTSASAPSPPFVLPKMEPGSIEPLRWTEDNKVVHPYTLEVALPENFQDVMIDYAKQQGFEEYFAELTDDHPLPKDSSIDKEMNGHMWQVQRPNPNYHSNMHWIGPADEETHNDFLRMLSKGGFDSVLEGLAKKMNLDGLTIVQVTYMAVSSCDGFYFHWDFPDTGGKAFNIIVPLTGVPGSPPELQIQDDTDSERTAAYKYGQDYAIAFGDNAMHATGKVKYENGHYRMGATIYVADINEENVDEIIRGFTQAYPPQGDRQWALDRAGMHYGGGNKIARSDFLRPILQPGEISNLYWSSDKKKVDPYTLEAGLPRNFQDVLIDYAEKNGILDFFNNVVGDHPLEIDSGVNVNMNGFDWFAQRPHQKYFSNMHWIGPANEAAHEDFLKVLSKGGFDLVLEGMSKKLGLETLTVVQVTYMAVTHCDGYFFHWDFPDTGGKGFNLIVPLLGVDGSPPELQIQDDIDHQRTGGYKYEQDHAIVFGDNAMHATGQVHYNKEQGFRMGATIYIADITEENVDEIVRGFTQAYPPQEQEGRQWALDNAGLHYGDGKKLPAFDVQS